MYILRVRIGFSSLKHFILLELRIACQNRRQLLLKLIYLLISDYIICHLQNHNMHLILYKSVITEKKYKLTGTWDP